MSDDSPILAWLRRDLRLCDQPMLTAAAASGRPVIPVFILDEVVERQGPASVWRLGLSVADLARRLDGLGSRLVLRRDAAAEALAALATETGAGDVWWTRAYDPEARARDQAVGRLDLGTRAFGGLLLHEPWDLATAGGQPYRVFTPYWRAAHALDVGPALPAVRRLRPPAAWPAGEDLASWRLEAPMDRGTAVVASHVCVGEDAALGRLDRFVAERMTDYARLRDLPSEDATSHLSENLACGEISVRTCWHAARRGQEEGSSGAAAWLRELFWREFSYHLIWHTPRLATANWDEDWDRFPWRGDGPEAEAWRRGRTGISLVDAGMREMFVTGRMHNRVRMVTASYLAKHLLTHWRVGLDWFARCLVDWDPAANALNWQWVAGSGPDAAPYFRVFNPLTQAERFDTGQRYVRRWIAEGQAQPPHTAVSYFAAAPRSWRLDPGDAYPPPVVGVAEGRQRALAAYAAWRG